MKGGISHETNELLEKKEAELLVSSSQTERLPKRKAEENEEKLLKILTDDEIKELKRILTKIVNNI